MNGFSMKLVKYHAYLVNCVDIDGQWPLLLTWFIFNSSMDK